VLWALVAVAGLLATGLIVVAGSDGDDSSDQAGVEGDPGGGPADPSTGEDPGDPGQTSLGAEHDGTSTPTEAEIDDLVAQLSGYVEEQRGLTFEEPVVVEVEGNEAFEERLLLDFDEDAEDLASYEPLYKATGLLPAEDSLADSLREALGAAVIGFYDPETKELVVRGAAITPAVRVTIVHELTHALDDQHFDLDRPEYDDAADEVGFGFSAVVEGNATVVENAYLATMSSAETEAYFDEQLSYEMPDVPLALLQLLGAPYIHGEGLVSTLRENGGQERLDAAFEAPPRTSEQVLHPDKFFDGEEREAVTHPQVPAGGEAAWEGVLGEVYIALALGEEVPSLSDEAAAGWGGDWVTTWTEDGGDKACMAANFVGDTGEDNNQLEEAWSAWADSADLDVDVVQAEDGDRVVVKSCTP
jgi:hypothetical protein